VRAQRLAPREAHETGTVALVFVPRLVQFIKLHLGDACEPAPEVLAVVVRTQLRAVRDAIVVCVGIDRGQRDFFTLGALRRNGQRRRRLVRLRRAAARRLQRAEQQRERKR
jgi:hypothetical protein